MHLTAIQLTSTPNIETNINLVEQRLKQLKSQFIGEHLVVLPECFAYFGGTDKQQLQFQEELDQGEIQQQLKILAKNYKVWLVAGTIPIKSSKVNKFYATSLLFSPDGQLVNHYEKMHLFDVLVADGTKTYCESKTTMPGERIVVQQITEIKIGFAVCYDLRFPGLFQQLSQKGAEVIVLPSAFTQVTGKAHWHALLKARAIENQVYLVAANQEGTHDNNRQTYGHSVVVNPWGEIIAEAALDSPYATGLFDPKLLQEVRQNIPVHQHNRFTSELI